MRSTRSRSASRLSPSSCERRRRSRRAARAPWCAQPVIRLLRKRRLVVAGAVLLCVLTASAYGAHLVMDRGQHRTYPLYQFAKNPAWFAAELKRVAVGGGTIRLPAGKIAPLQLFDLTPSE